MVKNHGCVLFVYPQACTSGCTHQVRVLRPAHLGDTPGEDTKALSRVFMVGPLPLVVAYLGELPGAYRMHSWLLSREGRASVRCHNLHHSRQVAKRLAMSRVVLSVKRFRRKGDVLTRGPGTDFDRAYGIIMRGGGI